SVKGANGPRTPDTLTRWQSRLSQRRNLFDCIRLGSQPCLPRLTARWQSGQEVTTQRPGPTGRSPLHRRLGLAVPASLPLPEAQLAAPHADQIARAQRGGAVDALAVEEGAAGGAGVVEQVAAASPQDAGMRPLDGGVAEQAD